MQGPRSGAQPDSADAHHSGVDLDSWRTPAAAGTLGGVSPDLLAPVRIPFRALAVTFVPEIAGCTPAEWDALDQVVSEALGARPPAVQRQILLFIRVLDILALLRHGRRLDALDPARRAALIEAIGNAPVLLLRRGVWGLRTLVMMGYYTQPGIQTAVGYRATPRGWAARR